ncbi:MAG TPA: riboflavin synthase [Myxococcota bacterium]|nr:riboflavin synthase [Myxococcota bacterium]
MFTGLVEDVGSLISSHPQERGRRLVIATALPLAEVRVGDSIAVDGVCLTAEAIGDGRFEAVAGQETLARTTLGDLRPGRRVHLERALRMGDRLGGHLVQGHVDGTGRVTRSYAAGETWVLWIDVGHALARYVVPKGSLAVDGTSLTVNEVEGTEVRLNLIPHTAAVTRLGGLRAGDAVNLEADLIAKYVERLLGSRAGADEAAIRRLLE